MHHGHGSMGAQALAKVGQSGGGEKKEGRDLFSAVQKKLDKAKIDESSDRDGDEAEKAATMNKSGAANSDDKVA